jgi:hypothetical protein
VREEQLKTNAREEEQKQKAFLSVTPEMRIGQKEICALYLQNLLSLVQGVIMRLQ